jgi:hypothetical protein
VYLIWHKYKGAHREGLEGYTELVAVKDPNSSEVKLTLVRLIYAECFHSECAAALEHARSLIADSNDVCCTFAGGWPGESGAVSRGVEGGVLSSESANFSAVS